MVNNGESNPAAPAIRPPAVAGRFYPDDRVRLAEMVKDLLGAAQTSLSAPKAVIAPHAGYVYSGPIAANAHARLLSARDTITRVVLLGPSHRYPLAGLAASPAEAFAGPLGQVPVDRQALHSISHLKQVRVIEQAHRWEHSLEVHLPFLQSVLDRFAVVPLVVGDASPREVGEVLEALWGGPETIVVVSSDLSHYHDYETAIRLDSATSRAIESLRLEEIARHHACGRDAINGLLYTARRRGMKGQTLDVRNSADTAGPRHEVVGYGAYAFE